MTSLIKKNIVFISVNLFFFCIISAAQADSLTWTGSLQGTVQGRAFERNVMIVAWTNQLEQPAIGEVVSLEVGIFSGYTANPETGTFWFFSNNAMIDRSNPQSLASITIEPDLPLVTMVPDPDLSMLGINGFKGSSGGGAPFYSTFDGSITITSQDGFYTLTGNIDLLGSDALTGVTARYTGSFVATPAIFAP